MLSDSRLRPISRILFPYYWLPGFLLIVIAVAWLVTQSPQYVRFLLLALIGGPVGLISVVFVLRYPFKALSLVLLLVPFHTLVYSLIGLYIDSGITQQAFSLWRELTLALILLASLRRLFVLQSGKATTAPELLAILLFAAYGALYIPISESLVIGLLAYRYIFEGVLVLFVLYFLRPSLDHVQRLVKWMLFEGAILAAWGLVSAYVLDYYAYLQQFGFISPYMSRDFLHYSSTFSISSSLFMRASSIFGGPNEFGLYLAILLVVAVGALLFDRSRLSSTQRRWYSLAVFMMGAGLLSSISRAAWVLVLIALVVMWTRLSGSKRKIQLAILFLGVGVLLIFAVPNLQLFLLRTLNLEDTSAAGRLNILRNNFSSIASNPLGLGLGTSNYKFINPATNTSVEEGTESYLFMIAIELGWPGLALYLGVIGIFAWKLSARTRANYTFARRLWALIGMSLLVATPIVGLTSVVTVDWIFQVYLWFFVAIALWGREHVTQSNRDHSQLEQLHSHS